MADAEPAGPCPDEELISAYVEHGLDAQAREAIEQHLDDCESCALVVADMVRIYSDDPSGPSVISSGSLTRSEGGAAEVRSEPDLLPPGSAIGRYRTLECVGIGGMGVVYSAYDPQLDRRVALKLLIEGDDRNRDRKRARLLREAQSMAKLTHPNVITVHDVGVWHGQVFVAMEFVEGGTLKSWIRDRDRSWPEIRETMLAAGRGLAAAHAAGLVHRDFKPDNVLIGNDGRVRVTDFGLARWEDGASSTGQRYPSASDASGSLEEDEGVFSAEVSLTRTGALVGTPAYMAPELYKHEVADAASDQFAFCVALYEAIYRVRPFEGRTLAELATAVVSGDAIEFPSQISVPRHVRNALRRGLSRKREERHPSMAALLAALERRGVRRWRTAAVTLVPLTVVGIAAWTSNRAGSGGQGCEESGAAMASVWSDARRERIRLAFEASAAPLAEAGSVALVSGVDEFAETWKATARATCEAGEAGGRETFVALSERCLAQTRIALDVALGSFEDVDEGDIARSAGFVSSIARDCADEASLLSEAPPPAPDELREDVERIRLDLAKVDGLMAAGDYDAGVELARTLDETATALGVASLQAETRLALGQLLDMAGEFEEAAQAFEQAELLAVASRFHRITAEALVHAVYVHGVVLEHHDLARALARRAAAAGKAAGLGDAFEAALLLNRASTEYAAMDYEAAETFAAAALELQDRDKDPLRWADAAFNLAAIRVARGRNDAAIEVLQQYIDTFVGEVGHEHPDVALGYHTLAVALLDADRKREGEVALRTALDITARTVGKDHPNYVNPVADLAALEAGRGNYVVAIDLARQAMAIRRLHGYEPLLAAVDRAHVAEWLGYLGRLDEARDELDRAEAEAIEAAGPDHPRLAEIHTVRGMLAAFGGDRRGAEAAMAEAQAVLVASFDPQSEPLWNHHRALAGMLRELGAMDDAIAVLRTLLSTASGERLDVRAADARFELAQLLESRAPGSAEARTVAEAALRGYRASNSVDSVEEVTAWLERESGATGLR